MSIIKPHLWEEKRMDRLWRVWSLVKKKKPSILVVISSAWALQDL